MKTKAFTPFCLAFFLVAGIARADVTLPSIFSDHMVLLKADHVPVWGWADAGETVSVTLNGQTVTTTAGSDGTWQATLDLENSPPGPFTMTVQGNNTIEIEDVVVGEVWLGSGQSNMEQAMMAQKHAEVETATADNPLLRQFIPIKTCSLTPKENVDGFWLKVSPGQTDTMSALGYYFSKEIHGHTGGAVGIIKASWGGRAIESFISPDAYDLDQTRREARAQKLSDNAAKADAFIAWLDQTERADRSDVNRDPFMNGPVSDADGWVQVNDTGEMNPNLRGYGAIWFRKEVTLTEPQSQVPQYLYIGMQDVLFFTVYVNGTRVEHVDMDDYTQESGLTTRIYLTPDVMNEGVNRLALRVYAPHKPFKMAWAPSLNGRAVTGGWRGKAEYSLPEPPGGSPPPAVPVRLEIVECTIFDGMIRPLAPYAVRGVLWYQGESNVGYDVAYRTLMPLLIEDWRSQWGRPDMPFYYCQLANHKEKTTIPGESKWAELRDAQREALNVPGTGMAVLIDTGESLDIHPQTKDIAGERLARIALANVYGQPIPYSGPVFDSLTREGRHLRLSFTYLEGGLVAQELPDTYWLMRVNNTTAPLVRNSPDSELEGFAVRGSDTEWVWADAAIDGDTVLVWSDEVPNPVEVRYAWADNPTCNLYNQADLPAAPFSAEAPKPASGFLFSLNSIPPVPLPPAIQFDGSTSYSSANLVNVGSTGQRTIAAGDTWTQSLGYSTTVAKFDPGTGTYLSTAQPVYGGHYLRWHNNTASAVTISATALQFVNTIPRRFFSQSGSMSTIHRTANFAMLFKINTTGNYSFDATSELKANMRQSADVGERTGRWVVVANDKTYVSESTIALSGANTDHDYTLSNPRTANWAEWAPGTDMSFGSLSYTVSGSSLEGITHAGIAENTVLDAGAGTRNVALNRFEATLMPGGGG